MRSTTYFRGHEREKMMNDDLAQNFPNREIWWKIQSNSHFQAQARFWMNLFNFGITSSQATKVSCADRN